jgi:hypothetical protein
MAGSADTTTIAFAESLDTVDFVRPEHALPDDLLPATDSTPTSTN